MYNRYGDISKFVTNPEHLVITEDKSVFISREEDYDIMVDLEDCCDSFENIKPFIVTVAKHVCELDNTVQRFHNTMRFNGKPLGLANLPSPRGILRFDFNKCMVKCNQEREFSFKLELIYIENPNSAALVYWATNENNEFVAEFEYKNGKFFLRKYGMIDLIPDDWDTSD